MLWQQYVFRRGNDAQAMWEELYTNRPVRLVYIAGQGFDTRVCHVLSKFAETIQPEKHHIEHAELLLISFTGYELSEELRQQTVDNAARLRATFAAFGNTTEIPIGVGTESEEGMNVSAALRAGVATVLAQTTKCTDIILDISSLPRVAYLALMTGILSKLVPDKDEQGLYAEGRNFQVIVAEDAALDSKIISVDLSNDIVHIPGFSSGLHAESFQRWPMVWFPVLGEGRRAQLEKIRTIIEDDAEICPVVPHPSKDPR